MGTDTSRFEEEISALTEIPGRETAGLSIVVFGKDGPLYARARGFRYIDKDDGGNNLPMTPDTLCRVASISKITCALTALIQEKKGTLDFSRDLSDYLGYPLRNPHFPEEKITAAHLLTHTSSLRDGTEYNLPKNIPVKTLLAGEKSRANWDKNAGPNALYHVYCNLGYGVLATVLERITGKTFDCLVHETLLNPLYDILNHEQKACSRASFNLQNFTDEERNNLAEIYRKTSPSGPWEVQCDSREKVSLIASDKAFYKGYEIGTNGTLFAPQGGLRASALFLCGLGRLFLGKGVIRDKRIVSGEIIDRMMKSRPITGPEADALNGECGYGLFSLPDALPSGKKLLLWGHHGDAYGLKGALYFDGENRRGFTYLMTGCASDPDEQKGIRTRQTLLEENLTELIVRTFW